MTRLLIASLLSLSLFACGDDDRIGVDGGTDAGGTDAGPSSDGALTDAGDATSSTFTVNFETTAGAFAIEVDASWAPNGAARFRELVESGYYDDQRIFRVVPGFVAQWGLSGDPAATARWNDNTIADDPVVESNLRGYVSFAQTSEPNSRSAQIFVSFTDNSFLDESGFAPFGQVVSGMEAVDAINAEYGEAPEQGRIVGEGNTYLDASFPNLTRITSARIQ